MVKILFLIHDLGPGGAEKVLVNLVNNMDRTKFDITVMALFDGGINRQFLRNDITYKAVFSKAIRGNSHIMKLFSPMALHRWFIKEHFDIEVSYLEGPCARIISGCPDANTKLACWIHIEQHTRSRAAASFRSVKEAMNCYNRFHRIVCVSETVKSDFKSILPIDCPAEVLYNTNESKKILDLSKEPPDGVNFHENEINLVGVGKLLTSKGFERVIRITERLLKDGYPVHTYILGNGPEEANLKRSVKQRKIENHVDFLGYQTNPYKYVAKCDLFVCASHAEGFSTAATEALILGVPVCTVEVSGMKEMLGENNEYGIVTANNDGALYEGIKRLISEPGLLEKYRQQAILRGKTFSMEHTVAAVENMLLSL